jgi:RNA polymerase sigma-70 factor (ECF subfamily)
MPDRKPTGMKEPLLPRIAAGESSAVRECLDRYGGLVWSLARRFLTNPSDVEDAVQEIFVDLWRNAGRYDPHQAAEATFVTLLARRRLIDRRRRDMRRPAGQALPETLASNQAEAPQRVEVQDEANRALRAMQELREDQRKVLQMAICQGLTHEEISQATGLPLGTVKTHVRRGLIRMREILQTAASRPASPEGRSS